MPLLLRGRKLVGEASRFARGDSRTSRGVVADVCLIIGNGGRTSGGSPGVPWQGRYGTPPVLSVLSPFSAQSRRNTFWCHDGLPREPSNS